MKPRIKHVVVCLSFLMIAAVSQACVEKTIRTGVPVVPAKPTPPLRVEASIQLEDFRKLCNYLPDEGDQMNETESPDAGKTVRITLGDTKRRQNPAAVRAGCTPGQTFTFSGPELRLEPAAK